MKMTVDINGDVGTSKVQVELDNGLIYITCGPDSKEECYCSLGMGSDEAKWLVKSIDKLLHRTSIKRSTAPAISR